MPIIKRVLPAASGFTHTIETKHFKAGLTVKAERVIEAAPQLHWTIGHRYDKVREHCSKNNWTLEKIEKQTK